MGRNYRRIPLRVVDVPQRYIDDKAYWPRAVRAIRIAPCSSCNVKGKNTTVIFFEQQWAKREDLPEGKDYLTKADGGTQEVIAGICQSCFDQHGVEAIIAKLAGKKAILDPKAATELQRELDRPDDDELNRTYEPEV